MYYLYYLLTYIYINYTIFNQAILDLLRLDHFELESILRYLSGANG